VVGSLTHCRGYCAVAVAPLGTLTGLGIDAEPAEPLEAALLERIGTSAEHEHWARLPDPGACGWGHIAFSAKESFYKCWFPGTRTFLGFHDAEVDFEPESGRFDIRLLRADVPAGVDPGRFRGRFAVAGEHILTVAWLEAEAREGP
jgi:4'-phosphopantetheinyl transferase EntD